MSVGFRPTVEDLRVIEANRREDENTSDVIRRALRLLDREGWEERARADMHRLRTEDLSAEADTWEYDADGNVRIAGANVTVPARPAERTLDQRTISHATSACCADRARQRRGSVQGGETAQNGLNSTLSG